jgi:ankyrin repeat protein
MLPTLRKAHSRNPQRLSELVFREHHSPRWRWQAERPCLLLQPLPPAPEGRGRRLPASCGTCIQGGARVNRLTDRRGPLFERRYEMAVATDEESAQVERPQCVLNRRNGWNSVWRRRSIWPLSSSVATAMRCLAPRRGTGAGPSPEAFIPMIRSLIAQCQCLFAQPRSQTPFVLAGSLPYNLLHEIAVQEIGHAADPSLDGPLKASRQLSGLVWRAGRVPREVRSNSWDSSGDCSIVTASLRSAPPENHPGRQDPTEKETSPTAPPVGGTASLSTESKEGGVSPRFAAMMAQVNQVRGELSSSDRDARTPSTAASGIDASIDLAKAAKYGNTASVQALLAGGAEVNAKFNYGVTALMEASANGHVAVVQKLLAAGAEVNTQGHDGRTALIHASSNVIVSQRQMEASHNGRIAVVKALLAEGAEVDAKDARGMTALIGASENNYVALVQELLAKGAEVNAKSNTGMTALMLASHNACVKVVEALLAKEADVNAQSGQGWSALMCASSNVTSTTSVLWASPNGRVEVVQALLANGAEVNAKSNTGMTALMVASDWGLPEVVKTLLAKGAEINAKTSDGRTALDLMRGGRAGSSEVRAILTRAAAES